MSELKEKVQVFLESINSREKEYAEAVVAKYKNYPQVKSLELKRAQDILNKYKDLEKSSSKFKDAARGRR